MIIIIIMLTTMTAFTKLTLEDANHTWQFNYSLANFGHIPYGHTITGYLQLPIERENRQYDLCNKSNLNQTNSQNNHWILSKRGNCTFTTKAINAQLLGAKLLIIVDNTTEKSEQLLMIDDGYGFQVYIPTLIVNKMDGESLITNLEENIKIHGIMSFNDSQQVENPNIILGLSFTNRESFRFLREFQQYFVALNNSCTFEIAYQMYSCSTCHKQNYTISQKDCLGGGRYCQDKPDQFSSGQDVLKEQLRQLCLFQLNQVQWFNYLNYFDLNCVQSAQFEQCFTEAIPQDLYDQVNICYKDSFDGQESQLDLKTNKILDQSLEFTQLSGLHFYPGALINYVPFRGNFQADALTEDICSVMTNPATICAQEQEQSSNNTIHVGMIIFVVVSFILFGLFLFFCYRRRIKQQAQEELGQQVNEMVSQYIKFYETKQQS